MIKTISTSNNNVNVILHYNMTFLYLDNFNVLCKICNLNPSAQSYANDYSPKWNA